MTSGLRVNGLTVKRGDREICRDVDLTVPRGEISVLLGANGAGKTTLLDGISGVLPMTRGSVILGGQRVEAMPVHRRARRGLAYVEQGRTVFTKLTVAQNLAVVDGSPHALHQVFDFFPRLAKQRDVRAGLLSGGEQQMLIIARALMTRPDVLLVDELSLGLAPQVVRTLIETLVRLAESGMGILLVEQFAEMALRVGTTAYVMHRGEIVRTAPCRVLLDDRSALMPSYSFGK